MILFFDISELTIETGKQLRNSTFKHDEDDDRLDIGLFPNNLSKSVDPDLVLLDVSANGKFQYPNDPTGLAKYFHKQGLLEYVKDIYIVASDLNGENPLHIYAHNMAQFIHDQYGKDIRVHVAGNFGDQAFVIFPPSKTDGKNWRIYSLNTSPSNHAVNLDDIESITGKQLLFEGENLKLWMDDPKRTKEIAPTPVVISSPRP